MLSIPTIGFNHAPSPPQQMQATTTLNNFHPTDKKMQLFDGVQRVGRLAVLMLLRDNAKYSEAFLFPMFALMEKVYDVAFDYYFLENNSKDATNAAIEAFLEGKDAAGGRRRSGRLITLDLPDFVNQGINFERIGRMAYLRNHLVDSILPIAAPWCLLIDSDIYFDVNALALMFKYEPKKNNVGLLGPFSREGVMGDKIRKMSGPDGQFAKCKDDDILITSHYYDTFAFMDKDSQNFWPRCPFDACGVCTYKTTPTPGDKLMYVKSCFGGFVLVDSDVFNLHRNEVRWDTLNIPNKLSICEHILFCIQLAAATKKQVAIAGSVNQVFWVQ